MLVLQGSESWSEEKKQALESLMAQLRGELREKEDGALGSKAGREDVLAALEAERNTLRANLVCEPKRSNAISTLHSLAF